MDGHVIIFTRSAPTNADEESFPCSSTHDSHDDGAIGDSCEVRAGRSLQAASDAASASSSLSLTSGRLPQASSAQQPMHDLLHVQCWGAGFAGGSGVVRLCVCASVCTCVPACGKQVLSSIVFKILTHACGVIWMHMLYGISPHNKLQLQTACFLFVLVGLSSHLTDLQDFSCRRRPTAAACPSPPHGPHAVAA